MEKTISATKTKIVSYTMKRFPNMWVTTQESCQHRPKNRGGDINRQKSIFVQLDDYCHLIQEDTWQEVFTKLEAWDGTFKTETKL